MFGMDDEREVARDLLLDLVYLGPSGGVSLGAQSLRVDLDLADTEKLLYSIAYGAIESGFAPNHGPRRFGQRGNFPWREFARIPATRLGLRPIKR